MLTRMTDEHWEIVVEVFRAVRSRQGDKGRDDRTFLQALHDFAVHNITWRALPVAFGNWNSIWKRFWRLSQAGVFEAFFDALAQPAAPRTWFRCSTPRWCAPTSRPQGPKGGRMARRWAAPAGASRPRSISRLISMACRSPSTSRRGRRATVLNSRSCSTSGRTSRRGLRWVTKGTTARAIARQRANGASAGDPVQVL